MWAGDNIQRAVAGGAGGATDGQGGNSDMSPAIIGGLVVGISLAAATILCTGLCLALWYRRLRGQAGDPSPATFLVAKRKPGQHASPEHPMAFVMPTITESEAGSEPQTPTPTLILTPTERSKAIAKSVGSSSSTLSHPRSNLPNPEDHPNVQRWDALASVSCTPPPAYSPPPPACRSQGFYASPPSYSPLYSNLRPRSASPKGLLKSSQRNPPLSLPLAGNRWTPRSAKRHRSASPKVLQPSPGTPPAVPPRPFQALNSRNPPALPPRSIFFRRTAGGTEDVRGSFQPHLGEEGQRLSPDLADLATPDSVDGWGPTWTPASSIASGGGCGLGELQVRLRYSMRTRLLRLTLLSADNLPLRWGPEPVDTYTKAVLLPDKRVRFSTRTVPALRNAHFNASFTHAARPSRLAHSTLRFSVCQVTSCGRRVVLGYAAVTLSSTGLRSGLNHDLDTGSLTLHLQESAPDQQVGMGGHLQIGLSWDNDATELTISILHLMGLQYDQNAISEEVQVYIKVTVYTNNTILCWRRTTPRTMEGDVTLFEEELILRMPELDLDATHLVLSARERTGPGCGRRVLGSCVVGRGSCVGEDGRHHWLDMLRAAPDIVVRTHPLAALAPFQNLGVQQNPPSYQNVFPGPDPQDPDLPVYHRYQNIGLLSSHSFPVMEIPGPQKGQSQGGTPQESGQEQDEPSSSDECHSSEMPTPDQCQSPEPATDEFQDAEMSSLTGSHHSEIISSDQSHYAEISPDHFLQENSPQDESSKALLSQQNNSADSGTADISTAHRKEDQNINQAGETIYCNQPPKYDVPKIPSEPIYAKPDLTLKRNNNNTRQSYSDTYSNQSTISHRSNMTSDHLSEPIYASDHLSEPIYDSPDLMEHRIYEKVELSGKHIYDKTVEPPQHMYQNSNLIPQNIYQVPDLSIPHVYQDPNMSPPHIYASPDLSPEHIYQMPYEASLKRYQNIDAIMKATQSEYQNLGIHVKRDQSKRRYENVPREQEESEEKQTGCPARSDSQTDTRHYPDSIDEKQVEYHQSAVHQQSRTERGRSSIVCDNVSDTSEVYHDARSSTQSSND